MTRGENLAESTYFDNETEIAGEDAAHLIVGNRHSQRRLKEVELVVKKIRTAYQLALAYYDEISASDDEDKWISQDRPTLDPQAIRSATMEKLEGSLNGDLSCDWKGDPKGSTLAAWLTSSRTQFEKQNFSRTELQRWIEEVKIYSEYRFSGQTEKVPPSHLPLVLPPPPEVEWNLVRPKRYPGYRKPLYDFLKAAHAAGEPCPKAREVIDAWKLKPPREVPEVMADELKYYDVNGDTKTADLKAIQQAIKGLLVPPAVQAPDRPSKRPTGRTT